MTQIARPFRLFVFALTLFYFVEQFFAQTYVWHNFGWQFRYLTIWGATASMIVAGLMLRQSFAAPDDRGAVFVSLVAVINMLIVVSYWRLYFEDPALVRSSDHIVLYREYYLHLLGPLLQWIDALWIKRAFRFPLRVIAWLFLMVLIYVGWSELVVAPLNDAPVGSVTSGLPYPFLNSMEWSARQVFYAVTFASGVVFTLGFWAVQWGILRLAFRGQKRL